jgi:hypothetical protein
MTSGGNIVVELDKLRREHLTWWTPERGEVKTYIKNTFTEICQLTLLT